MDFDREAERKEWARQQLNSAGVPDHLAKALMSTFQTWVNMMPSNTHDVQQGTQIFINLITGQAIEYTAEDVEPEQWLDVRPGNIRRGERVRVRLNAYEGQAGQHHNGRRGVVIRVSNGDVVVRYDDGLQPDYGILGSHHSPYKLEKRPV